MVDRTIYNKNDRSFPYRVWNSTTRKYVNITDWTIWFTVKTNKTDTDDNALILKKITSHTDAVNGLTTVSLSNSDTDLDAGTYYYDLARLDANGKKRTYLDGKFIVKQGITQAVA